MPRCSGCGQSNPEIARFCFNCGAAFAGPPASPAEARKTVTVLFADVVESTSLLDRLEPESARRVLDRFFETVSRAVESHGGTVEKFIGDAVMAVFGIPLLHEDDALRACRAADQMRAGLARLNAELEQTVGVTIRVRVGVNTGNVVVGDPARGQAFVTGEAVNVAARLETAARPGEVLIGEPTYRLVRHAVSTEPLEQLELKGKAGSVRAHRLLAVGAQAPARRRESLFVGREHELVELLAELERVRSESASRLVTVLGTAGVGKSRLVDEFLDRCADSATVVRGRCLPYGEGISFWPLKEAIGEAAGLRGDETAEAAHARIRALVATAADGELVAERLAETLGISEAVAEHRGSTWATRRLFEELARARPVVLVLDGLQWAEPTFLDLVEDLVETTGGTPLLVLCMARPELLETRLAWGGPADRSRQVFLQPLSADDTERLLASLLGGGAVDEAARSKIVGAADGLPLFVEEMVAMLLDDGSLRREDGRWVAADLARIAAPASIHALLAARLDGLEPAQRAVLERGSVEGQVFHLGAVRHLSPEAERAELDAHAAELVLKELVEPEQAEFSGDAAYRFHHLLLRDVAYESVQKEQRARLHARFADWLDEQAGERAAEYDEIVGYHLEQAYRCESELRPGRALDSELAARGASRLGGAGIRAHARGDWFAAANLLARAVELLPPDSVERARLTPKLDDALLETGPATRSFLASVRCFWSWPPGHRWVLKERRGELVFRCSGCGKERSGGRGQLSVPDGGSPAPPTSSIGGGGG